MNANVARSDLRPELRKQIEKIPALPFHIKPLIPLSRFLFNLAAKSEVADGVTTRAEMQNGRRVVVWEPDGGGNGAAIRLPDNHTPSILHLGPSCHTVCNF